MVVGLAGVVGRGVVVAAAVVVGAGVVVTAVHQKGPQSHSHQRVGRHVTFRHQQARHTGTSQTRRDKTKPGCKANPDVQKIPPGVVVGAAVVVGLGVVVAAA